MAPRPSTLDPRPSTLRALVWTVGLACVIFQLPTPRALAQAPANDNFTNRTTISGSNIFLQNISNLNATREAGEPQHSSLPSSNSVWYSWQAPAAGGVVIFADNKPYFSIASPVLAVYTGTNLASLARVASNAPPAINGNGVNQARVVFTAVAGQTYQIAVDGCYTNLSDNGQGSLDFSLTNSPPPGNDLFANATPVQGIFYETHGSFIGAGREAGEPGHGDTNLQQTLWWAWTAPANLGVTTIPMRLTADGVSFPPGLGVYVGNSVSTLTNVIVSQRTNVQGSTWVYTNGMTSMATFTANSNTTYYFALAGRENDDSTTLTNIGNYRLRMNSRMLSATISNAMTSTSCSTCTVTFAAIVLSQNLGSNASNPLRVLVSAIPGSSLRGGEPISEPIATNKMVLAVGPTFTLVPGQSSNQAYAGTIPAPFYGSSVATGWGAYAELQEQPPGTTNWFTADEVLIAYGNWPNFSGVVGPGGGVVRLDPDYVGLAADNPLASVAIVGSPTVPAGGTTNYFGKATYTLGDTYTFTQTVWTASLFTIASNGLFTAGYVTSNTLVNLSASYTNAGFRFIVATNVTVLTPPRFTNFKLTNNGLFLTLTGNLNQTFRIEAATNLPPLTNVWIPLLTNTLTNGVWNFTDFSRTNPAFPRRFYRARQL